MILKLKEARRAARARSATSRSQLRKSMIRTLMMLLGTLIVALAYVLFQVPFNIAAGGIGGIALIVNHYTGFPVGTSYWVLNIPMIILGFFALERWRFVGKTLIASTLFAIFTDGFNLFLPDLFSPYPITDNILLATIYGGIVGGLGGGLIYRAGGTMGGTGVLARVVQKRTGMPLSQVYLIDDGIIIFLLGLVFGWENALFGLMMLFLNGLASDYALEGASNTRTVTIVTKHPQEVKEAIFYHLHRGVSYWEVIGGYSGEPRYMLLTTIYRSQLTEVKDAIGSADPDAFVTIGISHQALGAGFVPLKAQKKGQEKAAG